jgi:HK97 family phage prohead protease
MTKNVKRATPEPGESEDDFMARCTDDGGSEEECAMAWEDRSAPLIVHKTHAATDVPGGMEFVLSDASVDRMGEVIEQDWELSNFKKNPIALFNHNKDAIVGRWKNLRVENDELRGHLELAPKGISARIDELRGLVEAGILKAVSVGFTPIKKVLLDEKSGKPNFGPFRYLKSELLETSLVSVPANANALAVAKSLNISEDTRKLVFAEPGTKKDKSTKRRGSTSERAEETLKTIYEWSPEQARRFKEWAANESKKFPSNLGLDYRRLQRLMEEIETVRTIQLLSRRHD